MVMASGAIVKGAAAAGAEEALSTKVLGLPLWVWGLVVAGGFAAYYYLPRILAGNFSMAMPPLTGSGSQNLAGSDTTGANFIDPVTGLPVNFSSPIDPSLVPGLGSYMPSGAGANQPATNTGYTGNIPVGCVASGAGGTCASGFSQLQLTDGTVLCCPSQSATSPTSTQPVTQPITRQCPSDMHPCGKMGAPNNGCCCNKPHMRNLGNRCVK